MWHAATTGHLRVKVADLSRRRIHFPGPNCTEAGGKSSVPPGKDDNLENRIDFLASGSGLAHGETL